MNRLARFLAAGACAAIVAGVVSAPSVLAQPATVVIGSEGSLQPLDPHRTTGTVVLRVVDAIFDTLVREDLDQATDAAPKLKPALAESWTASSDGLAYTFKLRANVTFHDGAPFNAVAVKANFDRLMDKAAPFFDSRASGAMTFLTRWIKGVDVVDASTVRINLTEPFSGLPRILSDRRISIVSPLALEQHKGDQLGLNPVGTGPFTLKLFRQGQPITLTRFDNYWGVKPKLEQLVFRPMTDPTAMATALQAGQVDIIPSASAQQVAQLKGQPGVETQYLEPANEYFIRLNMRSGPTKDARFRQALNYAVKREGLRALFDGQAIPATGPIPVGSEIYGVKLATSYGYDQAKAKELIAASGLPTPVVVKLIAPNSGPGFGLAPQVIALLQQDLKAVGVDLQVQYLEFATLLATEGAGYKDDIQGSYNGWVIGAESAYWLERMFSGAQQPPAGVNRGWYQNTEVDKLFESARGQVDDAKRNDLYAQAAEKIAADAPWIFLYQDRLPRLVRQRVTGVVPARSVYFDYPQLGVR